MPTSPGFRLLFHAAHLVLLSICCLHESSLVISLHYEYFRPPPLALFPFPRFFRPAFFLSFSSHSTSFLSKAFASYFHLISLVYPILSRHPISHARATNRTCSHLVRHLCTFCHLNHTPFLISIYLLSLPVFPLFSSCLSHIFPSSPASSSYLVFHCSSFPSHRPSHRSTWTSFSAPRSVSRFSALLMRGQCCTLDCNQKLHLRYISK